MLGEGGERGLLTSSVVFVVELPVDQRCHLLKVFFGFIEGFLEHAGLFKLVWAPLPFVGKHEDADGLGQASRDGGQEGADGLGFIATAVDASQATLPAVAARAAAHRPRLSLLPCFRRFRLWVLAGLVVAWLRDTQPCMPISGHLSARSV